MSNGDAGQRLTNLSTRGAVGNGANALISGLVVGGSQPKRILIRAEGGDPAWMARATSSLPVPLSPVIKTVECEFASTFTRARSSRVAALLPTIGVMAIRPR